MGLKIRKSCANLLPAFLPHLPEAASPKEKNILIPKEIKLFEGYVFHYEYWVGLPKEV